MGAEHGPAQFNDLRAWPSGKPEMRDLESYAKVVWDHEWADLDHLVAASLTSIVAPSFTIQGRDWATATVGTRVRMGNGLSGYAAVTPSWARIT